MNSSPLVPTLFPHADEHPILPHESGQRPAWLMWLAAATLFIVLHSPHEVVVTALSTILEWTRQTESVHNILSAVSGKYARSEMEGLIALGENALIVPAKKIGFILSVGILLLPIMASVRKASWIWERAALRRRLTDAAILFFALAILIVPRFLQGFGDEYATMSLSPFTERYGIFYRRFLMPSLAHLVGAYGYALYFFFSLLLTFCLVFVVRVWLEKYHVEHAILFSLSLMTSSVVVFNFQLPGYPEQIVFILLLLCSIVPMNAQARVAACALAFGTHEAAAFVVLPAALLLFPKSERRNVLFVLALYLIAAFIGHFITGFQFIERIVSDDTWNKPRQFFGENPFHALQGIFFGYKLFWIVVIAASWFALTNRMFRDGFVMLALVLIPMALIPIASDTSRLAGFGFFGVLMTLLVVESHQLLSKRQLQFLAIANLILPSCYVDLHSGEGMQLLAGAYRVVYMTLGSLAKLIVG